MEAMCDIVGFIKAGNDRFENIFVRMRSLAGEVLEATGYTLHMQFDERLNNMKLGMNERKNFYLIFKEAVNNIAKYAQGNEAIIEMHLRNGHIELLIKDNGKGFDTSGPTNGNGLANMRQRAELLRGALKIESFEGQGTLLDLRFPA